MTRTDKILKAIREEENRHYQVMTLISDPEFWKAHERGMLQIAKGECITLDELEAYNSSLKKGQ